jgi:phage-related protein
VASGHRSPKSVGWIGSSYADLLLLPGPVVREFGYVLYRAQIGEQASHVKPLKGFGGASVLEVIESFEGSTYRAIYTVRFHEILYVLHVFQKKSRDGIATPQRDIELVKRCLRIAELEYRKWRAKKRGE